MLKYKINGNQFETNYDLACELTCGSIEVYDGEELIDTIDFETAKQGLES